MKLDTLALKLDRVEAEIASLRGDMFVAAALIVKLNATASDVRQQLSAINMLMQRMNDRGTEDTRIG